MTKFYLILALRQCPQYTLYTSNSRAFERGQRDTQSCWNPGEAENGASDVPSVFPKIHPSYTAHRAGVGLDYLSLQPLGFGERNQKWNWFKDGVGLLSNSPSVLGWPPASVCLVEAKRSWAEVWVSGLQLTGRRARFKSCQVQGFGVIVNFKCVSKHLDVWLVILNKPKGLGVGEIAF